MYNTFIIAFAKGNNNLIITTAIVIIDKILPSLINFSKRISARIIKKWASLISNNKKLRVIKLLSLSWCNSK